MHEAVPRGRTLGPAELTRAARSLLPLLLAAVVAILTAACGGEPSARQRALLRELQVDTGPGGVLTCPGVEADTPASVPRSVVVDDSRRQAVVTCDGVGLRLDLEAAGPAVLDLSLVQADGPASRGSATAVVELRREGEPMLLLEVPVRSDRWEEHRVELPAGGEATLVFRSAGTAPVAWADLHLSPDTRQAGRQEAGRPSLILISLDTVRADHLSLYGYERPTTPRLERLGEESLVFTRALSSGTWTLPSTATLLSGLLPAQHGADHAARSLGPQVVTVAERLRDAGYRTAALTDGGFVGFPFGLAQGFDRYDVTSGKAWQPRAKDAAKTFGEAAAWVLHNRHRPFFLFVHTYEAHQPYLNREGFADPYLAPEDRGNEGLSVLIDPTRPERTPEELARMVALYDGEIARADHYLGTFLDSLEEAGLMDGVAVIVTSDHGEEFLEHGDLDHAFGKVFDPNVHVPLVVKPPVEGGGGAGTRIDEPVSGLDVAPTLLDLAGLPHDDLPGRSLLTPVRAESGAPRPVLVHGTPSFPTETARRYRLEGAGPTVILDRPSEEHDAELLHYDAGRGRVAPWTNPTAHPVPRLAGLVAWTKAGSLFARLPDDATRVAVPEGSQVRPRALWTGTDWRRVEDETTTALAPGGPGVPLASQGLHLLVFDLAEGDGPWPVPWTLSLQQGDGPPEPYRLNAERRPPWNPLTDPLPPEGAVQPTAALRATEATDLDEDLARELRALGYLQ